MGSKPQKYRNTFFGGKIFKIKYAFKISFCVAINTLFEIIYFHKMRLESMKLGKYICLVN